MSILASLTLSEVTKKSDAGQPHFALRRKMVAALNEQIAGAKAEANGQHYFREVEKTVVTDKVAGTKERMKVQRPLRRMWWTSSEGIVVELRFAGKPIKIVGKPSILVADIAGIATTLETVKKAVEAGELDAVLKAAADSRKRVKKDAAAAPKKSGK